MSTLLINELPLMVLPKLANAIGLNEAIVLQQIHYWLGKSTNVRDGYTWVYNSYPEWQEQFPFWSIDTIKRTIHKLEKTGLLVSDSFNTMKMDRTKWYRIDYDSLSEMETAILPSVQNAPIMSAECTDQELNLHRPIPETTTRDNNNEVNNYRKRLKSKVEKIEVRSAWQAKAEYVCKRLGTPPAMQSSVLKLCKEHPEAIDGALSDAVDAKSPNRTMLFFKLVHGLKTAA